MKFMRIENTVKVEGELKKVVFAVALPTKNKEEAIVNCISGVSLSNDKQGFETVKVNVSETDIQEYLKIGI